MMIKKMRFPEFIQFRSGPINFSLFLILTEKRLRKSSKFTGGQK